MRLSSKATLVTGAASGFGAGIAETFAREGAKVAVLERRMVILPNLFVDVVKRLLCGDNNTVTTAARPAE